MTKLEAINAMRAGKKVRHRFFEAEEWIAMRNNEIFSEQGYVFALTEFWLFRQSVEWETDWMLFEAL